jgi:hypothetical protein
MARQFAEFVLQRCLAVWGRRSTGGHVKDNRGQPMLRLNGIGVEIAE